MSWISEKELISLLKFKSTALLDKKLAKFEKRDKVANITKVESEYYFDPK